MGYIRTNEEWDDAVANDAKDSHHINNMPKKTTTTVPVPRRTNTLTSGQADNLITELTYAHYRAGLDNDSISRSVFRASLQGSGDVMKAISAASLSIGDIHAPLSQARGLIATFENNPDYILNNIRHCIDDKIKIPGFGNSFFKTTIDPAFSSAYDLYKEMYAHVYQVTAEDNSVNRLWKSFCRLKYGREIDQGEEALYPNAALITGAVVELCQGIPFIEYWVFLNGRTRAWIESMSIPEDK
jgi:hypothetical protein